MCPQNTKTSNHGLSHCCILRKKNKKKLNMKVKTMPELVCLHKRQTGSIKLILDTTFGELQLTVIKGWLILEPFLCYRKLHLFLELIYLVYTHGKPMLYMPRYTYKVSKLNIERDSAPM